MGLISFTDIQDGTVADAADVNNIANTIYDEFNGNIGAVNLTNSLITTPKLNDGSVTAPKIDFGGAGVGVWWEEIGRVTLGSSGPTLSLTGLPEKNYLRLIIYCIDSGAISPDMKFNNDSGTNYSRRRSLDGGASSTTTGATSFGIGPGGTTTSPLFYTFDITNLETHEKLVKGTGVVENGAGSGSAPTSMEYFLKWSNTTAQINRIDVVATSNNFAIGSELIVLGHD